MDLSEIKRSNGSSHRMPADEGKDGLSDTRWHDLVDAIGSEIAEPLTAALERIYALAATGRIDKAGLRALRLEVEAARGVGMLAQQLTRFAGGHLRQSHERLPLAATMEAVLDQRARDAEARGITLSAPHKPIDVIADASLLFSLLNALLDWSLAHALSPAQFAVDMKTWPAHARLRCRFAYRPVDQLDDGAKLPRTPRLDSLHWRLVEQTASVMGVPLTRSEDKGKVLVTLEFPHTVNEEVEGLTAIDLDHGFALSTDSKPVAGSHVLVVASRREVRLAVRDAIRHMGLVIDLVSSIDEAYAFCRECLPHLIIVEGILNGERFRQLRDEICVQSPGFPFIEIIEEGSSFAMSGFDGADIGRVGRDAIETALPSVLTFELSRSP